MTVLLECIVSVNELSEENLLTTGINSKPEIIIIIIRKTMEFYYSEAKLCWWLLYAIYTGCHIDVKSIQSVSII